MGLRTAAMLVAVLLVAACSGEPRKFRQFPPREGPDEFMVVPVRPLEIPQDLSALPPPDPQSGNRVDMDPKAEAVAALGGDPARLADRRVPPSDAALVAAVTRFGVPADIRRIVASEDREYRKRRSLFSWRLLPEDEYRRVYAPMLLDAQAELERFRQAGVRTPAAPPNVR